MILVIKDAKGTEVVTDVRRITEALGGNRIHFAIGEDPAEPNHIDLNDCISVEILPNG